MSEEHGLLFQNATFRNGINVTVRRGDKWHGREGETIEIFDDAGTNFHERFRGQARILGSLYMFFDDIPAGLLQHEHDPSCHTKRGLKAELMRVYEYGGSPQDQLNFATQKWTVLLFEGDADLKLCAES